MRTITRKGTVHASPYQTESFCPSEGWEKVSQSVIQLQMRIAKAVKQKRYRKMRSLQWMLAHSYSAKMLAIRRVTSTKGKNTPGVDGALWKTFRQKYQAVTQLTRRGYKARPLRRIYIPKKSGKLRPLGIPTMHDRAMQALYALTLAPIAESTADPNSYGFRIGRNCADAMEQCFLCLSHKYSPQWVLEADIASCFDNISHPWMIAHIPIDKKMLTQWLKAGYLDQGNLYPTLHGIPQGGIISPILMNMTLDGLEKAVRRSVPRTMPGTNTRPGASVIRYADDFIITGKTKELLERQIKPAVKSFLAERGLSLSEEKTRISRIDKGFDFLGQNTRKYGKGILLIQPTLKSEQKIRDTLKGIMKEHRGEDTGSMIRRLNKSILGWCNYHKHVCSSRSFTRLDSWLFSEINRWPHRRHSGRNRRWIVKKYFRFDKNRWTFHAIERQPDGKGQDLELQKAGRLHIIRHVKIRAEANPFDPDWSGYFAERKAKRHDRSWDGRFGGEYGGSAGADNLRSA